MRALKVVAEGITTSFRYPHFMMGVQPTYEMPPPATLYGHVSSALGKWFNPEGVQFALHFTFAARFEDMEHIHLVGPASGKLPRTGYPKAMEGQVNPFRRSILFRPRLTLYLNRPEWAEAFRHPRYTVALGRSQDLFFYTQVEVLDLVPAERAYLEHTLLPYSFAQRTAQGVVVLMPRFLDFSQNRYPSFERYVVLHRRIHTEDLLQVSGEPEPTWWVDPTTPEDKGAHLGLAFLSWSEEGEDVPTPSLA